MNSNKKKNVIRKIVGMTATMAIASVFSPSILSNTQTVLAQEAPVGQYKVTYVFESDTPGKALPQRVLDRKPADAQYVDGTVVTPKTSFSDVAGEGGNGNYSETDGYWLFQGFDADSKTIQSGDVVFTGKWKWFDSINVSYKLVNEGVIPYPKGLRKLEQESQNIRLSYYDYSTGQYNEKINEIEEKFFLPNEDALDYGHHIDEENEGYWTFAPRGYGLGDGNTGIRVEDSFVRYTLPYMIVRMEFEFTPTSRKVAYEFVSGTEGKDLPAAINGFMPEETEEYYYSERNSYDYADKKVVAKQPTQTTYYDDTNKGTWTFVAYDFTEKQLSEWDHNGWNLKFKGTWTFVADEVPAPTPQPETTEETTQAPTTEAETVVEQSKTTEVPTSEEKAAELPNTGTATVLSTVVAGASVAFAGLGMIVLGRNRKEN